MKAKDIMTPSPTCCSPTDSLQQVAQMMRAEDCGALPVVENGRVVGIVTDRDLTVRALADGKGPESTVEEVISRNPHCVHLDADAKEVEKIMTEHQVRRVPIVDNDGCCVGMVSQADFARAAGETISDHEVAIIVERISEPAGLSFDRGARETREQSL